MKVISTGSTHPDTGGARLLLLPDFGGAPCLRRATGPRNFPRMPTLVRRKSRRLRKTTPKVAPSRPRQAKKIEFVLSSGEIERINGASESLAR